MVDAAALKRPVLILGGTGDARLLVEQLTQAGHRDVRLSLAGATRAPTLPDRGSVRIGGFGGAQGLADYLIGEQIALLIDATHPYAAQITAHAHAAAQHTKLPLLRLNRPPWVPHTDDHWISATDHLQAASLMPSHARRIFLSIGRKEVAAYANCADRWFLIRSIEPPDPDITPARHRWISARGPFDMAAETVLMRAQQIDCLVTKNSGGKATYGKIAAARTLGLPVVMIARPAEPRADAHAETVADALSWVTRQLRSSA